MPNPNISIPASLIGEPTRAAMLMLLCDGHSRAAGELASALGITPQSASNHLALLIAGGLLTVVRQGRHRYFRLASQAVAQSIESLALIAPGFAAPSVFQRRSHSELQHARRCYSHLAGNLGVRLLQALVARGLIADVGTTGVGRTRYQITPSGKAWGRRMGIEESAQGCSCVDWAERRDHLAGALGSEILRFLLEAGHLRAGRSARALELTERGAAFLRAEFALDASEADVVAW